ncbi:MAG: prephenate dehydratase, partial [Chloroflexi bacterium]|nr:prephenate dehydratase [Chloroflexota bacterium]
MLKVAFQGERGAFSEDAVIDFFGESVEPFPCFSFSDVFENVLKGNCDFGAVPVENSQAGSINETYDLLLSYPLTIYGEMDLRVNLCIMALPGESMKTIKRIYSHPKALAQCDQYLQQINAEIVPTYDTSGSAKMIRETRLRNSAAVASERAAKIYQMEILACNIQTIKDNYTKFFIISREKPEYSKKSKTSIVFKTDNKAGTLYSCLGAFANRQLNLTKIESRPTKDKPWEYLFYVDFEGHADDS